MKPTLQIAIALIWRDGQILVTKRRADAEHLPDVWEFPGGKIEPDESPENAAVREAREEIGLEIEVTGSREPIEWDYAERIVILRPFDATVKSGEVRAIEVAAWRWTSPRDLKSEDFPIANRGLIEEIKSAR